MTAPKHSASEHPTDTALPVAGLVLPDAKAAEQAVAQLLGPLARLMIDQGVQLNQVVEQLKQALVQQANEHLRASRKEGTESSIALLTGVHRKDVKRLRQGDVGTRSASRSTPVHMAVVSRWISEPHYLNADQTPRPLAKTAAKAQPGEPDFTSLVAQVSKDLGARAVLDELLRMGVVHLTDVGLIVLNDISFVPKVPGEALGLLAANVHAHLATAAHNVSPHRTQEAMLEQSAFSYGLTPASAHELHGLARQLWAKSLQQFLQAATIAEERSLAAAAEGAKLHSVRFGVYFHDHVSTPDDSVTPNPLHTRQNASVSPPASRKSKK